MFGLISGIERDVIAVLSKAITAVKDEHSNKTYFSVGASKVDAAEALGLDREDWEDWEGALWSIRTGNSYAIGQIKNILKCDVVEGPSPSNSGDKPADDGSEE